MCGSRSAIGLEDHERVAWEVVKERLRRPGLLAGLMRGFLGSEEVAVVIATTPGGQVQPLAVLVTPAIRDELALGEAGEAEGTVRAGVGDHHVDVLLSGPDGGGEPLALTFSDWMREHLVLYARQLWGRRRR